jgi:hypothetical protein
MKTILSLCILILVACLAATPRPAQAAGGTDSWTSVNANCDGVANTAQHICEYKYTLVFIKGDNTPFNEWLHMTVEPGNVTDVRCQTHGTNIFRLEGSVPPGNHKENPWAGTHYGNIALCRGWINGGNGPVDMIVTYQ